MLANNKKKVSQGVILAEKIKKRIIEGYYRSGEKMGELAIANEFNVSRTVVRESLQILEKEGFIENETYKGRRVKKFTFLEIKEYYEVRMALECLCVQLIIDKKDKNLNSRLENIIGLSKRALKEMDLTKLVLIGNEFHEILDTGSGNKKLKEMLDNLRVISSIMRPFIWLVVPNRIKLTVEEHGKIAEAIIMGKKSLAIRQMKRHVINSYQAVEKYLKTTYFEKNGTEKRKGDKRQEVGSGCR